MRRGYRTLPLALLLLCATTAGPVPSAAAATVDVSMTGGMFSPGTVPVNQGATVRWTNDDNVGHSSRSNQDFWNGPVIGNGETYSEASTFLNAGSYGYHCEVHGFGMSGIVKVRMKKFGSPSEGWTIVWSSLTTTPVNRGFDVQVKRPGQSSFQAFRTNTQIRRVNSFNPTQAGTYRFRARTDNRSNGTSSGWSPVMSVSIS